MVPIEVSVLEGKNPRLGLVAADFTIVVDKKTYAPQEARQGSGKAGSYLLTFSPPEKLRDGKPHRIEVRMKKMTGFSFSIRADCCVWDGSICRGVCITIPKASHDLDSQGPHDVVQGDLRANTQMEPTRR